MHVGYARGYEKKINKKEYLQIIAGRVKNKAEQQQQQQQ